MTEKEAGDGMVATAPTRTRKPVTTYTAILASNCLGVALPPFNPEWVTCVDIEPHGAICITRITANEQLERFELSSAEFDALIAINEKRKAMMKRYQEGRNTSAELDDIPF